jgi:hypothetical protein
MGLAARNELMVALTELSDLMPDMRLGQLVCNLATMTEGRHQDSVWDVEDEDMLPAARRFLEYARQRSPELRQAAVDAHLESQKLFPTRATAPDAA